LLLLTRLDRIQRLRSSVKEAVLSQFISCRTTFDLWQSLHRVYAAISGARVTDLHRQFQSTTRGGQSCNANFEKMMNIADQLSTSGSPIADSDLISALLSDLGPEFNSFVFAITTRSDSISTSDLFGYVLAHEALLSSQHSTLVPDTSSTDPVVFYVGKKKQRFGSGPPQQFHRPPPSQSLPPLLPRPLYPSTSPYFSNGRGTSNGRGRGVPSQIPVQNLVQRPSC
jgi:gag-polypeptide of LTR copia-type